MGVPITFLDKWNPKQFKLIGMKGVGTLPLLKNGWTKQADRPYIGEDILYTRIFIQKIQ